MTQGQTKRMAGGWKLLAAVAAMALPFGAAQAQSTPSGVYNYQREVEPASAQPNLDQDRNDLISARHRADDLATQQDTQRKLVDSLRNGPATSPATAPVDAMALQQQFDAAKANADKLHTDAVARFEQGEAWKSQFGKFDQARKDLKGPTDAVLNGLGQTKEFQDLVATARTAKEKADKLHADKSADPQAVKDADSAFMAADNRVQEAAEKALTADARVAEGRKLVDASKAQLDALRDKFEQDLINDPAFGQAVEDVKARQQALDAANGQPTDPQLAGSPQPGMTLADAQTKLDQLNRDLDQARQDVDRLSDRVRQDEAAMANGDPNANRPPEQGPVANDAPSPYGGYQPDYGYDVAPYAVPVYAPAVAYGGYDYWSPGLSLGFSFDLYGFNHRHYDDWYGRWCRPYSYGYRGYGEYSYGSRGRSYGGYGYSYDRRASDFNRTASRGYYEGARYGGANRYSDARALTSDRSSNAGRASARYDYGSARTSGYTYSDPSTSYRERVQRREASADATVRDRRSDVTSREQADRSTSRERTTERSTDAARSARETPTYQRSTRSESAAPSRTERTAPTVERSSRSESAAPSRSERSAPSVSHSSGGSDSRGSSHADSSSRGSSGGSSSSSSSSGNSSSSSHGGSGRNH